MVLAEFIALIVAVAPTHPAAAGKPVVTTYNAIVAIEETPTAKDLARPAVFVGDGAKQAVIVGPLPGPIA
jgi:hypothetical protein